MGPRKRAKPNPTAGGTQGSSSSLPKTSTNSTIPSQSSTMTSQASDTSAVPSTPASAAGSGTPAPSQPPSQLPPQPDPGKDGAGLDGSRGARGSPRTPSQQVRSDSPSSVFDRNLMPLQAHQTRSWYGSWPRAPKSAASTQVARETILGGTLKPKATADFSRFETKKTPDLTAVDLSSPSSATLPHISENGARTTQSENAEVVGTGSSQMQIDPPSASEHSEVVKPDDTKYAENAADVANAVPEDAQKAPPPPESLQRPTTSSGWLGWFGKSSAPSVPPSKPADETPAEPPKEDAPRPEVTVSAAESPKEVEQPPEQQPEQRPMAMDATAQTPPQPQRPTTSRGSWFGFWSSDGANAPQHTDPPGPAVEADKPLEPVKEPEDVVMEDAPPIEAPKEPTPKAPVPKEPAPRVGSTWAFWSRDTGSKSTGKSVVQQEQGQLAVMGESSETHPKPSEPIGIKGSPPKEPPLRPGKDESPKPKTSPSKLGTSPARDHSSKKNKRIRPQSMDLDESLPSRPSTPKADTPKPESSTKAGSSKATLTAPAKAPTQPNLLLPSFRSTYRMKENPSILKQIAQLLLRTQQPPANHVFLSNDLPKIKKALAIGVHGLFPANYLRPMIGQPTGTSLKFANHCADGIRRWADRYGCESCEIEKIALEGEGKIGERVENLWRLLLNWIDLIRSADLIMLACHSQGVPVAIMLLAKLFELGVITNAKVGICAMAGVSLGPFPDYRSGMGMLMGSAAELWEFSNPESEISKRLEASLRAVLSYGARITYVGSIDDQLVPIESAIYSPANHPYIYRSVFIDGRIHAPDFIAHLVGFALKLRNLGVSDHGLIRELSLPLAGSLYSGEGHSRLYDDEQVYDLAVSHALETTEVANVPCNVQKFEGLTQPNPYHLPWIMRGLLEEDFVKTDLNAETAELLKQFDDWKPITKALKDVKYRLEAVRSKL